MSSSERPFLTSTGEGATTPMLPLTMLACFGINHPPLRNADHCFCPDVAVVGGEPPPEGVRREESPPRFFYRRFFRRNDCMVGVVV